MPRTKSLFFPGKVQTALDHIQDWVLHTVDRTSWPSCKTAVLRTIFSHKNYVWQNNHADHVDFWFT